MKINMYFLLIVTLILGISCSPARVVRQLQTTTTRRQLQTTTLRPATTAGTTTTTASPAYRRCVDRCLSTAQYNPVCGSDGVTYFNSGKLNCAIRCGGRVQLRYEGAC